MTCAPEQVGQWDAVATCFFIDTAHNVVEYLEIIWEVSQTWGRVGELRAAAVPLGWMRGATSRGRNSAWR